VIRSFEPSDLAWVLALNNRHATEVNELSPERLAEIVRVASRARVIDTERAFLVAFDERTPVQNPHHEWWLARRKSFVYVDRVVVAEHARGQGLARLLYEDLTDGRPICSEVNIDPPNPASLAFHEKLGFVACGESSDPRNNKRVRYLEKP
jgi:predicted GNAT superfamily acetyltransferase